MNRGNFLSHFFVCGMLFLFTHWVKAETYSVATLDWTTAETLVALGQQPLAVGDKKSYQVWVAEPKLANNVIDLGIRLQPNPEQLLALRHHFIPQHLLFINSSFYKSTNELLQRFGKVQWVDFYREGNIWQNVLDATQQIAIFIERQQAFHQLMADYWDQITQLKAQALAFIYRPIILVQFADTRHLRIYGENSLFGTVLTQLGFKNAWQGAVNQWGFSLVEVTQLAKLAENSRFVVIKPYPANIHSALAHNTLWQHLSMAKDPLILPAVWTFGGIPSAQRFANTLLHALQFEGEQW